MSRGSTIANQENSRPWKPNSVGDNGVAQIETTWGAMTAVSCEKNGSGHAVLTRSQDRKPKFSLKCGA